MDRAVTLLPAAGVLTVSSASDAAQRAIRPARRTTLVYPGIDLRRFDSEAVPDLTEARASLNLDRDVPIVGMVARLQRWKGLHLLIEALPQVRALVPGHHRVDRGRRSLRRAGIRSSPQGPRQPPRRRTGRRLCRPAVRHTGLVERDERHRASCRQRAVRAGGRGGHGSWQACGRQRQWRAARDHRARRERAALSDRRRARPRRRPVPSPRRSRFGSPARRVALESERSSSRRRDLQMRWWRRSRL